MGSSAKSWPRIWPSRSKRTKNNAKVGRNWYGGRRLGRLGARIGHIRQGDASMNSTPEEQSLRHRLVAALRRPRHGAPLPLHVAQPAHHREPAVSRRRAPPRDGGFLGVGLVGWPSTSSAAVRAEAARFGRAIATPAFAAKGYVPKTPVFGTPSKTPRFLPAIGPLAALIPVPKSTSRKSTDAASFGTDAAGRPEPSRLREIRRSRAARRRVGRLSVVFGPFATGRPIEVTSPNSPPVSLLS